MPCHLVHPLDNEHVSWRWLLFDYADPELPLTLWKRLRIVLRWRTADPGYDDWLRALISVLIIGGVIALVMIACSVAAVIAPITFLIAAIAGWMTLALLWGTIWPHEWFARLREDGFNCCITCGYWLRGLDSQTTTTCPECGERLIEGND